MIRAATLVWAVLAIAVGVGLFMLKYEVQGLEDDLTRLNAEIRADRAAVHVLEAEWSYLNDPARLRDLATRHLGMAPVSPAQVSTLAQLPLRPQTPPDGEKTERKTAPRTAPPAVGGGRPLVTVPPPPPQAALVSTTGRTP